MTPPRARVIREKRVLEIEIIDPEPFELPTKGHFGGLRVTEDGPLQPYLFTPALVKVALVDGIITDMGALPSRGFHLIEDVCQNRRRVRTDGVVQNHWPLWLSQLVGEVLTVELRRG